MDLKINLIDMFIMLDDKLYTYGFKVKSHMVRSKVVEKKMASTLVFECMIGQILK